MILRHKIKKNFAGNLKILKVAQCMILSIISIKILITLQKLENRAIFANKNHPNGLFSL